MNHPDPATLVRGAPPRAPDGVQALRRGAALIWAMTRNGARVPPSASQMRQIEGEQYAPSHFLECPQSSGHSKGKRR